MSEDLIFSFVEMVQRGSRSEFGDPDESRKIVTKDPFFSASEQVLRIKRCLYRHP
jgi:hypothetical protein